MWPLPTHSGHSTCRELVTTVAMTTLVVAPFYLTGALGLSPAVMGLVMTAGPLVAALAGVPAGRGVDRYAARRMTVVGVAVMTAGCSVLAVLPVAWGVIGYVPPLATTTAGFAIFQAANNTAVVTGVDAGNRGVVSGLLSLSRNLGLITGASAMGAVFSAATGKTGAAAGDGAAIATGMHVTFAVAALLSGYRTCARHRRGRTNAPRSFPCMRSTVSTPVLSACAIALRPMRSRPAALFRPSGRGGRLGCSSTALTRY